MVSLQDGFAGHFTEVFRDGMHAHRAGGKAEIGMDACKHGGVFTNAPREACTVEHRIQHFGAPAGRVVQVAQHLVDGGRLFEARAFFAVHGLLAPGPHERREHLQRAGRGTETHEPAGARERGIQQFRCAFQVFAGFHHLAQHAVRFTAHAQPVGVLCTRHRRHQVSCNAFRITHQLHNLSVCVVGERLLGGRLQILQRLVRLVGVPPMMRKQCEVLRTGNRLLLVPVRHACVQMLALIVQHEFVGHLLGHPVRERKGRRFIGELLNEVELLQLHQRPRQLQPALAWERGFERRQLESVTDDTGQLEGDLLQRVQCIDACGDDALDGIWNLHIVAIELRRGAAMRALDAQQPPIAQRERQCFAEVRMAFGLLPDDVDHAGGQIRHTQHAAHQFFHFIALHTTELQQRSVGPCLEHAQFGCGHRHRARDNHRQHRANHAVHIEQQSPGRGVQPLRVFEYQHHAVAGHGGHQQPRHECTHAHSPALAFNCGCVGRFLEIKSEYAIEE